MGERLLLAVRAPELKHPIWFYHHWLGSDVYFIDMVTDIYIRNELYNKMWTTATDWVRGILSYADDFEITNAWDDKNYMAAILPGPETTVAWLAFYGMEPDEEASIHKQFVSIMEQDLITSEFEFKEKFRKRVTDLFTKVKNHIVLTLDGSPKSINKLIMLDRELNEERYQILKDLVEEVGPGVGNFYEKAAKYHEDRLKELAMLAAKVLSEQL